MERFYQNTAVRTVLALVCCALWGSAFPCVKIGYQLFHIENAGSQILFAGYRFFMAGVFTFLLGCILERRIITMKKASIPYVFGQGILQTTLQYVCFYIGLAHTTGAKGSVINASNAFFSIIAAHFLMKSEKLTWKKIAGCLVGFAGIIIINLEPGAWGSDFSFLGEGMVLVCACSYGLSSVTLKMISDKEKPVTITAYQLLFGGAVLILLGVVSGGSVYGFNIKSSLLLLYMSLLSTVAFSIWAELLKYNSVGKVAIFGFSIPVFGVGLSAIFLGEQVLSVKNLAALICVSVGIIIINRKGHGINAS
ncbi:MAG: DMT family transporter [Dorea sp.]|jgi:drug/metabolite transporter (DMT)-like permease|uniref:DMT family transporter n=1 Tax=Sporofaciens musculi TaxID=2681861 RepID=UPI002172BF58|nr:DMT family transporter [Sporofaciens musculi]MCI9421536.1 DMT family transporter [Dorea sp.]